MEITPGPVPLTARELQMMHGLTVEQGLRQGYCIEGYVKEYREAHKAALVQEQRAINNPGYSHNNYRDRYRHKNRKKPDRQETLPQPAEPEKTIIREETYTMDKNTRITLLLCLMESTLFDTMEQTEKAVLLTELLYGEKATPESKPKHPGGRPKKAAAAGEMTEEKEECK